MTGPSARHVSRRDFLKGPAAAAGAAAGTSVGTFSARAPEKPKPKAELKLCSQDSRIPGKNLKEKVENLQKFGGVGMEFGGNAGRRIQEIKDTLKGTGVKVATICAGYFPLIDPNPQKRKQAVERLKGVLTWAAELESTGAVVVPAFNQHPQLPFAEGRKVLVDLLSAVGEYAVKCGTRVLLEPLNRGEARFLNQLAVAASSCRDCKSDGIAMMGDFYHMFIEETSDEGAFLSAGKYLHHVHLASQRRNLPGQDERSFVAGFRGLKRIGYRDYCSLECGCKGDPMVEIPKSFAFKVEVRCIRGPSE